MSGRADAFVHTSTPRGRAPPPAGHPSMPSMRCRAMRTQIACGLVALIAVLPCAHAETFTGTVVGVADGDTITVLDNQFHQHKVRLVGIDAPEKKQDYGQRSKQNLAVMVFGRSVSIESRKADRYGRMVGKVIVDGTDVNLRQVEAGLAWHYKTYEREQEPGDRAAYAAAETAARADRRGLWAIPAAQPPWEFRRSQVRSKNRVRDAGY